MHDMYGEKEFKLGTHLQVSIVNSYIREVHSSNHCGFLPDSIWSTMSHANAMTRLMVMPHLISWNAMYRHMEIIFFHGKHLHFTCEILHVATCVHTHRNEVVIEWYHIYP